MAFGGARGYTPVPPEKGSFPLDHEAACKQFMQVFLDCLKTEKNQHHKCKQFSKQYLECRMEKGLMAKEDLDELGFKHQVTIDENKIVEREKRKKEKHGFFGGLEAPPTTSK